MNYYNLPIKDLARVEQRLKTCFNISRSTFWKEISDLYYKLLNDAIVNIREERNLSAPEGLNEVLPLAYKKAFGSYLVLNDEQATIMNCVDGCLSIPFPEDKIEIAKRILSFLEKRLLGANASDADKDFYSAMCIVTILHFRPASNSYDMTGEYDLRNYQEFLRPDMLKTYIAMREARWSPNNWSVRIAFGDNPPITVNCEFVLDALDRYFEQELKDIESVEQAREELNSNYKIGRGRKNRAATPLPIGEYHSKDRNTYLWGIYHLAEGTVLRPKNRPTAEASLIQFIAEYFDLLNIPFISDGDTLIWNIEEGRNNIKSLIYTLVNKYKKIEDLLDIKDYKDPHRFL